jgi:hypothetical protein
MPVDASMPLVVVVPPAPAPVGPTGNGFVSALEHA